jgi:hypothetical protein
MKTSTKLLATLDIGSHSNAAAQPLLEAVGCSGLFGWLRHCTTLCWGYLPSLRHAL